ncbi:MAG TPA: prolyl oligopeptidase family serine peptidase, partial [Chthoniobacterales bacterium]
FAWIGDPQLSPDGTQAVFVRISPNEKKEGYDTSLWLVATAGGEAPHRLTSGNHDATPRWSPDGKSIAFVRASEKDGKPEPGQLFMLPLSGGDAWQFTSLPKGATNPVWSPDGKTIAFTSTSNPEDLAKAEKKNENGASPTPAAKPDGEHESDVHVITRAVYRSNDEGYLDAKRPAHIWTIQAPRSADEKVQPKQLTSGRFREGDAMWSRDGAQLFFTSLHVDEPYYELPRTELYSLNASGGEPTKITTIPMGASDVALSPDGKQIAFVAAVDEPVNSYTQPDLWVMDVAPNAQPRNLTASFDFDITAPVFGDSAPPRAGGGTPVIWSGDGKSIYQIFSRQGRTNLGRFDATSGALTEVTKGDQCVFRFKATPDGSKIVYEVSTPTRVNDLFVIDGNAAPRQLTDINRELFSQINLSEPEEIWYDSFDGKKIQAWVQKPPNFDAHKKYPLILNIHGGPHAAYGWVFSHEFQWMAAKGYVVLYPNPRGSTTYGQEFGNVIQYHYPGDD